MFKWTNEKEKGPAKFWEFPGPEITWKDSPKTTQWNSVVTWWYRLAQTGKNCQVKKLKMNKYKFQLQTSVGAHVQM